MLPLTTPAEKYISFNGAMLAAVRANRKTVTRRRISQFPPLQESPNDYRFQGMAGSDALFEVLTGADTPLLERIASPFGQPGDQLRVVEDPKILLEIVRLRTERVQAITEAQALAEGIVLLPAASGNEASYSADPEAKSGSGQASAVDAFRALIESIYPTVWVRNEWVWGVEFRLVG